MAKRALVLGGGGARGPYQIGVWKALRELSIDFSIVTGTSVGALNGAMIAQGDYDLACRMWESLTVRDVIAEPPDLSTEGLASSEGRRRLLEFLRRAVEQGGLDVSPLEGILRATVDEEKVRQSPVEFGIVTSQFPYMKPVQLLKEEIPQGELVDYMMASAAWFPFFQRRNIGGKDYVDGAYSDNMPAELARKWGADEIIAVDLQGIGIVHTFREEGVPVTHIRSHWNLGDMLEFDSERAKRNIRMGYLDGLKAYRKLEGSAYAFHPGETRKNTAALLPEADKIRHRTGVSLFKDPLRIPRTQDTLRYRGADNRFFPRAQGPCTVGLAVTTAAEIAGELMEIPPDKTYTLLQFNRLLLEQAQLLHFPREAGGEGSIFSGGRRRRLALRRLYGLLWDGYFRGRVSFSFWRLAALSPAEFIAANYLLALEIHYRKPGRARGGPISVNRP